MSLDNSDGVSDSASEPEPKASAWESIWENNKGAILILLSESAGSSMDAIARLLQQSGSGSGMHPFQVIFARMSITFALSILYLWWKSVPDFPLGKPNVRGWLLLRATFGFGGLFCLYYSVHYLPLAIATVFRFIVPLVTALACSVFLTDAQPFTRSEFLAGIIAIFGVVIIAHPSAIFDTPPGTDPSALKAPEHIDPVTPAQRLLAICVAALGIFGASGAYTTIRIIGSSTHALISVAYFSFLASVGSAFFLLVLPNMSFTMPQGPREWILLSSLGILGFVLQFLLTKGLQLDRSSKATSMMYTQVLFALAYDWGIWGVVPGWSGWLGGAIVVSSTAWCALRKVNKQSEVNDTVIVVDEESALLGNRQEDEAARGSVAK